VKVFGKRKPAGLALLAVASTLAVAACTPSAPGSASPPSSPAESPTASAQPSTTEAPSLTAPPSPSASPNTSATVGALVAGFPQKLLPLMPNARIVSSSFDKTTTPATAALVGSVAQPASAVVAYYTKELEAQGFKAVPGENVGAVASKDFLRGDSETVNISVVDASGVSTFTIGANVAPESAQ
jgi:hypothetical protein